MPRRHRVSAYALLCFLAEGYDHRRPSVPVAWLKKVWVHLVSQQQDGVFHRRNYSQGVATMAIAEAYGMTQDPALKPIAQAAVDVLLARQSRDEQSYPYGWGYDAPAINRQDSSVSGWCIMALKSAKIAELNIGDGLTGGKRMLQVGWEGAGRR